MWTLALLVACGGEPGQLPTQPPAPPSEVATITEAPQETPASYTEHCAVCHGPEARGDGPAGASVQPPASNLATAKISKADLERAIREGVPETSMAAYADRLSPEEIESISSWLVGLQPWNK